MVLPPGVREHRFEPGAESARRIVLELRQVLNQHHEHVLGEVGGIGIGEAEPLAPLQNAGRRSIPLLVVEILFEAGGAGGVADIEEEASGVQVDAAVVWVLLVVVGHGS